ncbi:MAG: protease modulator HflC [Hyphomicrobiales bacterium]|nr:protease modulator HflC [Hyphomicrobiales bacterium]
MTSRMLVVGLALIGLAFTLIASSAYVINEGEQGLVVRLGAPVGVVDRPGLKFKAPFIDAVYVTSTRSLLLEPPGEQAIMGDQKRLEVQPYARYRIVDPLRFYQALRTPEAANAQLAQIVSSSARRALGQSPLRALLTEERGRILDGIKNEVAAKAEPLGLAVDVVRFHRAELPFETSQAIYDRMKSERQREAKELRAQGFETAQQIQARADHERTVVLSEAERAAAIARGEGDAEANRTLAEAFSQNPEFYSLYRSLKTYKQALANSSPTLVVSPDADFMRLLKSGPETPTGEGAKP